MPAIAAWKVTSIGDISVSTTSATVASDGTFSPDGIDAKGVARYVDRTLTIPIGRPTLSVSMRKPSPGSSVYRLTLKYSEPTLETPSPSQGSGFYPAPTLAYVHSANIEMMLPVRGTLTERNLFFSRLQSLFATHIFASDGAPDDATGSPLQAMVQTLEAVY